MAAVGRAGETSSVGDNIYDNSAKEITPALVREALAVIIESNFNLVDDVLKNVNYDTGQTLAQKFNANPGVLLNTKSSVIPILSATVGGFYNGDANATFQVTERINTEVYITVAFSTIGTTSYIPIINWSPNGTWHENISIIPAYSDATATSIRIYLQRAFENPSGVVTVTLIKV
jgi:hypothetical protein